MQINFRAWRRLLGAADNYRRIRHLKHTVTLMAKQFDGFSPRTRQAGSAKMGLDSRHLNISV
jgi:hypothetical protein